MQEYHLDGKSLEKGSCNRNFLQNTKKVTPKACIEKKISIPLHPLRKRDGRVAQLNRVADYGSAGYRFESCRGHSYLT